MYQLNRHKLQIKFRVSSRNIELECHHVIHVFVHKQCSYTTNSLQVYLRYYCGVLIGIRIFSRHGLKKNCFHMKQFCVSHINGSGMGAGGEGGQHIWPVS
jgi:hypothetical protein